MARAKKGGMAKAATPAAPETGAAGVIEGEVLAKADAPRAEKGGVRRSLDPERVISVSFGGNANQQAAAWFGPQTPMRPSAPPSVIGRRFDYPSGYNLNTTLRPFEIGFPQLRGFAEVYDVLRLVIETRKDQLSRLKWAILPIQGPDAAKWDKPTNNDEVMARAKEITAFFRRPDKRLFWNDWLRCLLEDLLVIDAPTVWKRRTRGGALWSLEIIDGATINPIIDPFGRTPENGPAFQQVLKGVPAAQYTARDIHYAPRNRRPHKVFGQSPVEQIMLTVNIALKRQMWQLQHWTEGNIPEAMVGLPETWGPDQIQQFQDYWDALHSGDTAARRGVRFVPGTAAKSYTPTHSDGDDYGKAEEWLARVVCYAFGEDVTPFINQPNRATAESAAAEAVRNGMAPIQSWVKNFVDTIILDEFGCDDVEFVWQDDTPLDPNVLSSIVIAQSSGGLISINEARAELGKSPLEGEHWNVPMVKTGVGFVPVEPPAQSDGMGHMMGAAGEDLGAPPPPEGYLTPGAEGGMATPANGAGTDAQKPPSGPETDLANAITDGMKTGDFSDYNKVKSDYNKVKAEQEQAAKEKAAKKGEPPEDDPEGGGAGGGGGPAPASGKKGGDEPGAATAETDAGQGAKGGAEPAENAAPITDADVESALASLSPKERAAIMDQYDGDIKAVAADIEGEDDASTQEPPPGPDGSLDRLSATAQRRRKTVAKMADDVRRAHVEAAVAARRAARTAVTSDDDDLAKDSGAIDRTKLKPGERGAVRIKNRRNKVPWGIYARGAMRENWNLPRNVRSNSRRGYPNGAKVRDELDEDRYWIRVRRDNIWERDHKALRAAEQYQAQRAASVGAGAAQRLAARAAVTKYATPHADAGAIVEPIMHKAANPFGLEPATFALFSQSDCDQLAKAKTGGVARRIAARIGDDAAAADLEKLAQRTDAAYRAARRAVGKDRAR